MIVNPPRSIRRGIGVRLHLRLQNWTILVTDLNDLPQTTQRFRIGSDFVLFSWFITSPLAYARMRRPRGVYMLRNPSRKVYMYMLRI